MSHAAEGSLQAYIDGELDGAESTALREHLASCDVCAEELDELRSLSERTHGAFSLIDTHPPMVRAHALIRAREDERLDLRRRIVSAGGFGFAKAAMLLLALAGAGAAIIPGSPLRDAIGNAIARVFGAREEPAPAIVETPAEVVPPAAPGQSWGVAPESGRVRIILRAPEGDVVVRVRSTDDALAQIESTQQTPLAVSSANGRAELRNVANSTLTISIPRSVSTATIEIDGEVYVTKQNGTLQQIQPRDASRVRVEIED
jgi:anti-sigma factor RsiW